MATAPTFVFDIWYFAAFSAELKRGAMRRIEIAGHPICFGRSKDGALFALRDICPHRAAPLSAGKIIDGADGEPLAECPYHGWTFKTASGQCTKIPSLCEGQKDIASGIAVRRYPVREEGNLVWVYIASATSLKSGATPSIDPPAFEATQLKPRLIERLTLNCHVDHAVVGLMDPAHGPYVHQQWWWRSRTSMHEKSKAFAPRLRGFAMEAHSPSSNSLAYKLLGGKPVTEISFTLPGIRTEEIKIGAKTLLSFTAVTPVNETQTEITQCFFTDKRAVKLLAPLMRAGVKAFLRQDGDMVDLQQQGLKYGPRLMLIDDADQQAKWYYAIKKEWESSRAEKRGFKNPVKAKTLQWRS